MPSLELKPTHKPVQHYYTALRQFDELGIKHEGAVRPAYQKLVESCSHQFDWKLVPEYAVKRKGQADAKAGGALVDNYDLNAEWEKAVTEFKERVPQIGKSLKALIEKERQTNKKFITAFEDFCSLCRGSLSRQYDNSQPVKMRLA